MARINYVILTYVDGIIPTKCGYGVKSSSWNFKLHELDYIYLGRRWKLIRTGGQRIQYDGGGKHRSWWLLRTLRFHDEFR